MICNSHANDAMNRLFGGTKFIALLSGDPTQSGSFVTEMVGASYERKQVAFTPASGRSVASADVLWWADIPNTPIRYVAVCTAITGGTMIAYQATGADVVVPEGMRFVIAAGDLAFTLNG